MTLVVRLYSVLPVLLLLVGCADRSAPSSRVSVEFESVGLAATTQTVSITYGVVSNELTYVLIEKWKMGASRTQKRYGSLMIHASGDNTGSQWLRLPGRGESVLLDDSLACFIYSDDTLVVAPLDVRLPAFRAWLKSEPVDYSLESLHRFVQGRTRTERGQTNSP